jgi:hypothetical protein
MKKAKCYRNLFLIAAIWNLLAGFSCWLGGIFMPDLFFGMFGMPSPASLFPFHAMFWFIISFGIGYLIVSHDISKNQGVVYIGIIGKVLFFTDCIITVALKEANFLLIGTGVIDLIFAILFIEFLLTMRKSETFN